jgi:hypothetical protein
MFGHLTSGEYETRFENWMFRKLSTGEYETHFEESIKDNLFTLTKT